jgi:RNA polymerase sigma factor (sigma-70 family)
MSSDELNAALESRKKQISALAQEYACRDKVIATRDCVQIVKLAFVAAAHGDPERPVKAWTPGEGDFEAYAMTVARWMLEEYTRNETSRGLTVPRTVDMANVTIQSLHDMDYRSLVAPPTRPVEPTFPPNFWNRIEESVTPRQWQCISMQFRQRMSQIDIAKDLDLAAQTVNETVQLGLANIRKAMPELSDLLPDSREP